MIRDPSDGTVREPAIKPAKSEVGIPASKAVIETGTSGLATDRLKADELARLEKSRDWLKEWFNRRAEQTETLVRSPDSGEG